MDHHPSPKASGWQATHHDHSAVTHSANCDACGYVAEIHAHDADEAVDALAANLETHNRSVHGTETPAETIKEPIRAKMVTLHEHQV